MEAYAANLVMLNTFAAKSFLLEAADLAITLAAKAGREIAIVATNRTAAWINTKKITKNSLILENPFHTIIVHGETIWNRRGL